MEQEQIEAFDPARATMHTPAGATAHAEIADAVLDFLRSRHGAALRFWTDAQGEAPLKDVCDVAYALRLAHQFERIAPAAPRRFRDLLLAHRLAGALSGEAGVAPGAGVHLTAYALGTLNLIGAVQPGLYAALDGAAWRLEELVDAASLRPKWPAALSHHSWRASHWVGGAPSILLSLSRALPESYRRRGGPAVAEVLRAADGLIDARTGFLRLYKSDALHRAFNAAYAHRHDPLAAELGGVTHLHWVNYACGRGLVAEEALRAATLAALPRGRFMERAPYCLDFDILFLLRVNGGADAAGLRERIARYRTELCGFLGALHEAEGYALHKLPGALAALHECALIEGAPNIAGLGEPVDIIREGLWL